MLTYNMENRDEKSLYAHLYACLRSDIEGGVIAPNEKLPSKRAFAKHLGVSVVTVEGAYAQLVAEGYVRAEERRGYFACELPPRVSATSVAAGTQSMLALEGLRTSAGCGAVIDLTGSSAGRSWFPLAQWSRELRATLSQESEKTLLSQPGVFGHPRLREAIAHHVRSERGMHASPDQVVVGAGAQTLYSLIVQLIGSGGAYAVEDPGYPRLTHVYHSLGVRAVPIPLEPSGVSMTVLERSGARVAHLMPSHQFPTGGVTAAPRRYELLAWAAKCADRYIVEDDYDCQFRLAGRPLPTLQSMDACGKVIYANTFTKSMGPSFRLAYLVLPERLAERLAGELSFYSSTVGSIEQVAMARFLESGAYERHVSRLRTRCRMLRDVLLARLAAGPLASRVQVLNEDAGLSFLLRMCRGAAGVQSVDEVVAALHERGVRVRSLASFCQGAAYAKVACATDDTSCRIAADSADDLAWLSADQTLVVDYSTLRECDIEAVVSAIEDVCVQVYRLNQCFPGR